MSQAKLLTAAFTKIPQYEEHIAVQNLPFSVDPILLESDYQIVLPPLVADKCTVSQQKCDSTNILQRLTSRRREKHMSRLREWYEKLSKISQDIENQVKECCENTANLLNTSWERQNQILNANLSDEHLLNSEISDLDSKWNQLDNEYIQRRNEINHLENQLYILEYKRINQIKQEFHELTDYLSKYSHLTPNELQIALQKEIFTIDIELLENRRELANLIKNLHLGELMNQRFTNLTWSEQRNHWQIININEAVQKFRICLNDEKFRYPNDVKLKINDLTTCLNGFEKRKDNLINELCENLIPSNNMEEFLENWNVECKQLFTEWDEMNQDALNSIYKAYEDNSQQCIDQIQQMKDQLLDRKLIGSMDEIENLIKENCITILGELQSQFENNLNYIDHCFSWCITIWLNEFLPSLLKFIQLFIKLWQFYASTPLININNEFNDNLLNSKQVVYEEINKKNESINSLIDIIRQSSTEQIIDEKLKETMNVFNEISILYKTLYDKQLQCIDTYVKQIPIVIDSCETAICRFFGVMRCTKQQSLILEKKINHQTPVNKQITLGFEQYICIPPPPQQQQQPSPPPLAQQQPPPPQQQQQQPQQQQFNENSSKINHIFYYIKHHDNAIDDLIKFLQSEIKLNDKLNQFIDYLIKNYQFSGIITGHEINNYSNKINNLSIKLITKKSIKSNHIKDNDIKLFMINNNNNNNESKPIPVNNYVTDYIQPIKIEKCLNIIKQVKGIIRMKILEYLEQWKNTTMLAMKEEVIVRKTEIDDEYQLQLKLHEPRIDRVKEDIVNVRLTELVLHQTRIDRHITSVNLILNEMKNNSTNSLIDTLNKSEEQMNESIQHSIDLTINKATKSSTLLLLRKRIEGYAESHTENVRQALKEFRQNFENQIQTVNNSNLKLIESLELFVDGGNFSTVEAKKYTTVLNQLSKTIQSFQEEIIGSIESIEKERQLIIDNKLKQFESMLKPYLADVIYMENMIRCITNTKVQIKAQTEDSSSQSKLLINQIEQLQSLLKSLHKTNDIVTNTLINITLMDSNQSHRDTIKEKRIQKDLIHKTIELFTNICVNSSDRCIFLNCLRSQFLNNDDDVTMTTTTTTTKDQDEISNENNIGNNKDNLILNKTKLQSTLQTPIINIHSNRNEQMKQLNNQTLFTNVNTQNALQISRPGRLYTDDSYIQLVQNIINESNPLDENIDTPNQFVDNLSKRNDNKSYELTNLNSNNNNKQVLLDDNQKSETIPVTKSTKSHRGKREMNSSTTNGTVLKTSRRKKNIPHTTTNKTIVKHNRPQAYYDTFGKDVTSQEGSVELSTSNMKQINIEQVTYIGRIQKICRENLHNALHLSENYYRQKGIRQPTHPDIIKSTFDDAANSIVTNLKTLFNEAESYHHSCVKEFSQQLNQIEYLASQLPYLLFQEMLNEMKFYLLQEINKHQIRIQLDLNKLNELRIKYSDQLRPELCNLSNQHQLITLLKQENERQINLVKLLYKLKTIKSKIIYKGRQLFSQRLSNLTDYLFIRFDSLIGSDQIDNPDNDVDNDDPLKSKNHILNKSSTLDKDHISTKIKEEDLDRGKRTWEGVQFSEPINTNLNKSKEKQSSLLKPSRNTNSNTIELNDTNQNENYCIVSAKTTKAHRSTLKYRDITVEEFQLFTQNLLEFIEMEYTSAIKDNEEYKQQWIESVNLLTKLN
ncbi:unnamed protein product [Schistosoma rodhaini]|uniref:DUF4456 domain-containing protein n=1 Tax=Schistosoma rodhaini TaxID=6188 RepID=A0AA85GG28_9TREM|nr:unnamed protein product [Schistosoma rodhaini]CAH8647493.1 unnamed protein product [Schistosoma rodhaini]